MSLSLHSVFSRASTRLGFHSKSSTWASPETPDSIQSPGCPTSTQRPGMLPEHSRLLLDDKGEPLSQNQIRKKAYQSAKKAWTGFERDPDSARKLGDFSVFANQLNGPHDLRVQYLQEPAKSWTDEDHFALYVASIICELKECPTRADATEVLKGHHAHVADRWKYMDADAEDAASRKDETVGADSKVGTSGGTQYGAARTRATKSQG